jgi:hypothetical protein
MVHVITGYKRAFSFLYPGNLRLFVPVQVRVKIRQAKLIGNYAFIVGYRNGKL